MNTPTNPTPAERAEQFRIEIRSLLDALDTKIENMRAEVTADLITLHEELQQMREGLTHASQPAPSAGGFTQMMIDTIIMTTNDDGKPIYKASGEPYRKYGVRVWDEVLPALGIKASELKLGKNPVTPIAARVLMNRPEEGKVTQPRKVIGKA